MTFFQRLVRRPRSTWLWRSNFFLHSLLGLVLTIYLIVVGVSGSVLVFRAELERLIKHTGSAAKQAGVSSLSLPQVVDLLHATYPDLRVISVATPDDDNRPYVALLQGRTGRLKTQIDPQNGALIPVVAERSFFDWLADLHATFLLGRNGRVANGVGAALLLAINGTGLVIWWSGSQLWQRGLTVDWRRHWRRINFDAHRAIGFWTLASVSIWSVTGIYFAWSTQVRHVVNKISPLVSAQPPVVRLAPVAVIQQIDIGRMLARAQQLDPGTRLVGMQFPYSRRAPYEILMQRSGRPGREYTDVLYFSPWDGSHLQTWRYGVNQTLGDWLIWLQIPIHFGTFWGLGFKVIWASLGLAIPVLAVTGALLYWNRVLRHRL